MDYAFDAYSRAVLAVGGVGVFGFFLLNWLLTGMLALDSMINKGYFWVDRKTNQLKRIVNGKEEDAIMHGNEINYCYIKMIK